MSSVLLIHWHEAECEERAARLRRHGHTVDSHWRPDDGGALTRRLRAQPPDAVVIDLGRLPSHGRAVATWLRERKATRAMPIVFVPADAGKPGAAEKTARLRAAFPDAVYAPWGRIAAAVRRAIAAPPVAPIVPRAPDYSGTPLWQKLGVKADGRIGLVRAPRDFAATLGELPAGARTSNRLAGELAVIVLFCRALAELRADWPRAVRCLADGGSLWIAWPKKTAGVLTDLDGNLVRAFGLDQGLVDTKVCAIDEVWSGLRFQRRRPAGRAGKAGKASKAAAGRKR
ncbi:MAG: hypothetical protein KDE27_13115 [Planctomycetes bacterium]|nr:hypothetical protein [Planctomycetota bacterium]